MKLRNLSEANKANLDYQRGDKAWSRGDLRSAFRFFLAAARAGMAPAFRIVGQFYERGDGVRTDKDAALYWYRLASQDGDRSAANNIGCIWRERGMLGRALRWFERAVELGDADANLEVAKIHFHKGDRAKARPFLNKTLRSRWATQMSKDEARLLLKQLKGNQPRSSVRRNAGSQRRAAATD